MTQPVRAAAMLVVIACVATAHAEDKQRAREAFRKATQHYDLGEYQQALDEFKDAYRNFEDPAFLFNIAQCHRALNNRQEAVTFYRTYLRKSPAAPNRDDVQKTIAELESAIAQEKAAAAAPPMGTIAPSTKPAEAPPPSPEPATTTAPPSPEPLAATATPPPPEKPLYKRWWLWTAVGVVAVGAATGIALGVTLGKPANPTATIARVPGP